jgi:hypothetical protein
MTAWGQVSTFDIHINNYSLIHNRMSNFETPTPAELQTRFARNDEVPLPLREWTRRRGNIAFDPLSLIIVHRSKFYVSLLSFPDLFGESIERLDCPVKPDNDIDDRSSLREAE